MTAAAAELRARLPGAAGGHALLGWLACLAVTFVGGVLRFWRLDRPHKLVFDETYYVKQAVSFLRVGYELRWDGESTPKPDAKFTKGTVDVFLEAPDFVVHPPVGKWMIAAGIEVFGPTSSYGWRFSAALVGTLSILMLARIARRLFGSTLLGVTAGLLLAVDGHHFVHSRTSLLDVFLMFWVLAAFGCLLIDRDRYRARLARLAAFDPADPAGPWAGLRPWRIAAGVCLGLAIGTKWSGLYFLAAFGILTVLWDAAARRAVGVRRWYAGPVVATAVGLLGLGLGAWQRDHPGLSAMLVTSGLLMAGWFTADVVRARSGPRGFLRPALDAPIAFMHLVPVALAAYMASWAGWFASSGGYDRQWAASHPSEHFGWLPASIRSLWKYHQEMYGFHINLSSPHPYQANPWSWLVMGRPTAFFYESKTLGQAGCAVEECSRAITPVGNPVIWWGATIAVFVLLFRWAFARDWRAGAILVGIAAGYLPWFAFQDRTIYNFYAIAFTPWVVLALTYVLGLILGCSDAPRQRRIRGAALSGVLVVAAILVFAWFLPIYTARVIPRADWAARMWLPSWI
jgi:dolichyl-phosphate-mannose--protein O-mannosyl transferase